MSNELHNTERAELTDRFLRALTNGRPELADDSMKTWVRGVLYDLTEGWPAEWSDDFIRAEYRRDAGSR